MRELVKIECTEGMLNKGKKLEDLARRIRRAEDLSVDVTGSIIKGNLFELGSTYGNPCLGYPLQYEHFKLTLSDCIFEITVYHRATALLMTDDEQLCRIDRVACMLEDLVRER
jgi:hypothetical protein